MGDPQYVNAGGILHTVRDILDGIHAAENGGITLDDIQMMLDRDWELTVYHLGFLGSWSAENSQHSGQALLLFRRECRHG